MNPVEYLINVNQITELAQRFPDLVAAETRAVLTVIHTRLEAEVVKRTPAGVGGAAGLRGSIHGQVQTAGTTQTATVGTPLAYGAVVEYGRAPGRGMPPVAPLALWAMRKLGVSSEEATSVGFAIARTIAVKGTTGQKMFTKAWADTEGWVMDQISTIAPRVIAKLQS